MDTVRDTLPIFDRLSALADTTRCRLLLVLERHELTVSELCAALQLPQSTVSRHLKVLADEGWVTARPDGTSRFYRMAADALDSSAQRLWRLVREQVAGLAAAEQDAQRVEGVLRERRTRSQEFFSTSAGEWDRLRVELFGARWDLLGLLALLDPGWTVGDLGCGTGQLAASLAPFVGRVIAVDDSPAMIAAAQRRLGGLSNVEVRSGRLEALPIDDGRLDAALLFLVLHHVVEPVEVLKEVARVLRPGGRLLIVDMMPHDREEYRREMGHVWLGFSADQLRGWAKAAGLTAQDYRLLPADPAARGPTLFAATARR
jgi:ArsR family transcriptional regulator